MFNKKKRVYERMDDRHKIIYNILQLYSENRVCKLSNAEIASILSRSKGYVSRLITELNRLDMIDVEVIHGEDNNKIVGRKIKIK
ncbi:MAG: hypothetical protein ACOC2U_05670 [bacterium]